MSVAGRWLSIGLIGSALRASFRYFFGLYMLQSNSQSLAIANDDIQVGVCVAVKDASDKILSSRLTRNMVRVKSSKSFTTYRIFSVYAPFNSIGGRMASWRLMEVTRAQRIHDDGASILFLFFSHDNAKSRFKFCTAFDVFSLTSLPLRIHELDSRI